MSSARNVHINFLREKQFVQPRENKARAIAAARTAELADCFYALRDKHRAHEFNAGVAPPGPHPAGDDDDLADFVAEHMSSERLAALDFSMPPMSPSPPPPSPSPRKDATATARVVDEEQLVIEETPELEVPPSVEARDSVLTETPVDDNALMPDADADADATPLPTPANPEPDSLPTVVEAAASGEVARAPKPAPLLATEPALASQSTATSPALVGSTSPSRAARPTSPPPSSSVQTSPSAIPTASTSQLPYTPAAAAAALSPPLPTFAPTPVPSPVPFSAIGPTLRLPAIDPNYAEMLPELPAEVLRTRLFGTPRRKGKEKAAVAGPDLYKMHVKAHHTGAKTFLGRSKRVHNVLSTRDWTVGLEEVRATRAYERIEQLKQDKAWSFRQPKKQRTGLVPKAHWDHVLDEMRWLQTDFRQERRWKVTSAYNMARAVKQWHRTPTADRHLLCVSVRPHEPLALPLAAAATDSPVPASLPMKASSSKSRKSHDHTMDFDADADGEDDAEGEREATVDADADADGEADADADGEADDDQKIKTEPGTGASDLAAPIPAPAPALAAAAASEAARASALQASSMHLQSLIAYRAPVFELGADATVIDPRLLDLASAVDVDATVSDSLANLFPEIPLYTKDFNFDPQNEKRWEDSSAWGGKLSFVTHLLETKPLLVSTLEPARTKGKRGWDAALGALLEDSPPAEHREIAATTSALFSHPPGKRAKEVEKMEPLKPPPSIPAPAARSVSLHWVPEEDALVLSLQKQYGTHWELIAEVFNATTNRPAPDYRLGWDLYDRWDKLVGPSSHKVLADGTEIPVEPPPFQPPVDRATGKSPQFVNFDGSRKRLRHLTVYDAMRKVQKKREITAAKQATGGIPRRINMSMHESHNLPPRRVLTPMEWSEVKVEQDANKLRMRQQQELQMQQQRLQQQALQHAQLASQHQGGQPGPNGVRYPQPVQGFPLAQNRPGQNGGLQQPQPRPQMSPNGTTPIAATSASPPLPMPSPNGFPAQYANGNGNQLPPNLTPEQVQLFTQHRAQLMYQAAQASQHAALAQQAQADSQG